MSVSNDRKFELGVGGGNVLGGEGEAVSTLVFSNDPLSPRDTI